MPISKRDFLNAISKGQDVNGALPVWLHNEATKVVRTFQTVPAEDVVQVFLESIVAEGRNNRARVPWHLLTDAAALGLVRRRMRQLACELGDNWNFERALRSHVSAALDAGLPEPPNESPYTVCEGEQLSRVLIATAAAWLVAREQVPATLREVTRALKVRYHFQPGLSDGEDREPSAPAPDDVLPDEQFESDELAASLIKVLGPEQAKLIGCRLDEQTLSAISKELGLGLATIHDRERKAKAAVCRFIEEHNYSRQVARSALRRLTLSVV